MGTTYLYLSNTDPIANIQQDLLIEYKEYQLAGYIKIKNNYRSQKVIQYQYDNPDYKKH